MINTTLVLLGSGEFTEHAYTIDQKIFKLLNKKPLIAILPTAAGEEIDCWKWVETGVSYFSKLNIESFGLHVLNKSDANNPEIVKTVEKANIIYLSGGNPGFLLDVLQNSLLWKKIYSMYKKGTVIAASSAGAMVMGKYVLSNPYQLKNPEEKAKWKEGLKLSEFSIIPHYDYVIKHDINLYQKVLSQTPKDIMKTIIGIDENTGAFLIEGILTAKIGIGDIHLVQSGKAYNF